MRFIVNENGETVANFYITGKGEKIVSGTKHFYDNLGNEIGSAEFSNGELDAAHCTSWNFQKSETEVTGEDDEAQTLSTYDDNGNVSRTETKSRKEGETKWQSQTVKTDYDEQGQVTKEYTPRGTREDVAAKYTYDILGRKIQSEIPQEIKCFFTGIDDHSSIQSIIHIPADNTAAVRS